MARKKEADDGGVAVADEPMAGASVAPMPDAPKRRPPDPTVYEVKSDSGDVVVYITARSERQAKSYVAEQVLTARRLTVAEMWEVARSGAVPADATGTQE
jgi:hypothetical protein